MELYKLTIKEAQSGLSEGKFSSVELTEAVLSRIREVDKKVDAFLTVTEEVALSMAKDSDERRKKGEVLSELDGIPIAIKDLFCTKGIKTTASSKILEDFVPFYESEATDRLWKAGAVLIGKTNLDQFAMGSSTETSAFKTTKNPWDISKVPGGSSGGSAAAVSADMCVAALGTDTGGSIRQPAGFCNVVGLKPTYGRVSRYGAIAMASSLDCVGPMTKTVEDAAIMLEVLAGVDEKDSTTLPAEVPKYTESLNKSIKGMKIGVPEEFFDEGIDPEIEKIIKDVIEFYKNEGAEIVPISLSNIKYALSVYYIIMPAEVASNLARYDGIRYGHSILKSGEGKEGGLDEVYFESRSAGFGDEAKRRIMLGNYVLSSGYYDAYYKKAQQVRTLVKQDFEEAFEKVDAMITPVSPSGAFNIGEKTDDPLSMYMSDICTVPINPAGVPAISVPAGFTKSGLPVGFQIIAPQLFEERLFQIGSVFEKNNEFYKKRPKL